MKAVVFIFLSIVSQACAAHAIEADPNSETTKNRVKQTLLVELFTSEGCSSCPPAEELLARFESEQPFAEADLVTLAFHVDYWDDLGWKDKYASPLFTQRQRVYDRKFRTGQIYTPQMVVDGDIEFVGSREKDARKAIAKAAKTQKAAVVLEIEDARVNVSISGLTNKEQATLYFALAEDKLSSDIRRGENAGKNLTHLSVVRSLRGVARIAPAAGDHTGSYDLQLDPQWNRENVKLVVFVQENGSRDVAAVGQVRVKKDDHQRVS